MAITKISRSGVANIIKSDSMLIGNIQYFPNHIAVAHDTTPYISVYPWSSGFGTKYTNPATLPTGVGQSVVFL